MKRREFMFKMGQSAAAVTLGTGLLTWSGSASATYAIVPDSCNKTAGCGGNLDCIRVCPVDAFYQTEDKSMGVHPEECIDCGACEPECPAEAIFSDVDLPASVESSSLEHNLSVSQTGKNVTK
uniref:Ferredoxin n=1 Tax=Candidatus Kentrum sp. FM TaxID=2126340 RepID=A0A450W2N6_9GAMM|nr:MAG: NAD-dependent dihydropyrimidine dehydrogenase, PreA subunit [Candidatus Kentron sp. FM]VFJ68218.1 MAG: NAD-dependent dihydropyrimidine dehydrogenase, PreA subunit [Candidatus Kentron sp. FM]VFK11338.1 MAG: NAD-dependent dihydropyrimidine dehydrogenase, PreA subunit [Candidatus Kentron sp. FM]